MTARRMAMALGVIALATAGPARADDDKAVPRGGGGGGSHSSGAEARHPSSGVSSSSDSSHSSSGFSSRSSSGSEGYSPSFSTRSGAELRHPRPGTGTGWRGGRSAYYYGSPYYRGYGYGRYGYGFGYYYPYDRFYGGFHYGYSPYYYSGYYGYSPYYYGYRGGYGYRTGSLRLLVEPREARVYVDGYYAGIVDDFDGIFQRLNLSPGRHEITFKLEGFRSYRVRVYVPLDQTVKIHHRMVSGSGTDVDETTVGVPMDDERYADRDDESYDRRARDDERYDRRDRDEPYGAGERGDMGSLRLDVQPPDASVYVDGDFKGTARQIRGLSLPAGRHRVEIVRPGFRTVERDVEIRPGQTTDLEVSLDR